MIEDKLTRKERIRLECLAQANARQSTFDNTETIIDRAKQYEAYVKGEN